jgi:N6-adenosine-specific RNA methylase IME4
VDGGTVEDLYALEKSGQRFSVIAADPPWPFKTYSVKGKDRSADRHYDTKPLDAIKALPVRHLASDQCALFLWATNPQLSGALEVIKAWGFTFKTVGLVWIKQNRRGQGLFMGLGYWTRANAEVCFLATRGRPKRLAADVHQVIMSPVREHSRNPDEARAKIERLLAGPYLELYGRQPAPGWTVWGNEVAPAMEGGRMTRPQQCLESGARRYDRDIPNWNEWRVRQPAGR